MKKSEEAIPVGTFVFLNERRPQTYGVVVDTKFWNEKISKENSAMFEAAMGSGPVIARIMLLCGTVSNKTATAKETGVLTKEQYIQRFTWAKPELVTRFADIKELRLTIEQVISFAGDLGENFLRSSLLNAEEVFKFLKHPHYNSELCDMYRQAFPGMKAGE